MTDNNFGGLEVGDLAFVTFADHAENSLMPLVMNCMGRLAVIDEDYIVLEGWYPNSEDGYPSDIEDPNVANWCIIRSTILQARKLKLGI